jgi:hypothetical protein
MAGCGSLDPQVDELEQPQLAVGGLEAKDNGGLEIATDAQGHVRSRRVRTIVPVTGAGLGEMPKPPGRPIANLGLPKDKVRPKLRARIDRMGKGEIVELSVAVEEANRFSPLPSLDESLPRDAPANVAKLAERQAAFEAMAAPRREALRRVSDRIRKSGGEVLGEHVLGSTVTARLPAALVDTLSAASDIKEIASSEAEPPPADGSSANDTIQARAKVGADPFVSAGYNGNSGWIGLLDTGVRSSHVMLTVPSPISLESDCYRGGSTCRDGSQPGYSTTDTYGHGTSSAAIISGTVNLGGNWRGVTAQQNIDSWKISQDSGGTDSPSVQRAYNQVVLWSEWAIVATIQVDETPSGGISTGANSLFDMGVAVFASNGNFSSSTTRAPANATKVLGIGGYDLVSGTNYAGSGGTPDGRHKPDLRTPTGVETASAKTVSGAACDSCQFVYGGTSCAAPMAAGTASLLRSYFLNNGLAHGPGHIYAGMIAFGNESPNDTNGSGRTKLAGPSCSRYSIGQVTLTNGQIAYVPVTVGAGESNLKAAIWWPTSNGSHTDIDLRAENPSGGIMAFSQGIPSVFERVQVDGALQTGTWQIRIKGFNIPFGSQTVYYVVYNKSC